MPGITGLGTTYNLPNFTGELMGLTPEETPLLSSIGGLTGGGQSTSTEFEWQFYDLREPGERARLEGAVAPTAEERVRSNVTNVTQIHQEKVSISYTKQGAVGLKAGTNNDLPNPVGNELDWQLTQSIKQIARDVEWSFLNGSYDKPGSNATPRRTRGLLEAIVSNRTDSSTQVSASGTLTQATSVIAAATHGLANGAAVTLRSIVGVTNLTADRVYYVVNRNAGDFQIAATPGGTAISFTGSNGTAELRAPSATKITTDDIDDLFQMAYDNGGIQEQATATLMVNSHQKRNITKAYGDAYGKYQLDSRTVGGVAMETLLTDFGTLNIVLNRFISQDAVLLVSLDQLVPVFLEVPGKGHFFAEPLAKTGASEDVQLYGEIGLKYGNEKAHGLLRGAAL